ncbi:hypothetical protein MMPV_007673 [Pyropia vietnamensis]
MSRRHRGSGPAAVVAALLPLLSLTSRSSPAVVLPPAAGGAPAPPPIRYASAAHYAGLEALAAAAWEVGAWVTGDAAAAPLVAAFPSTSPRLARLLAHRAEAAGDSVTAGASAAAALARSPATSAAEARRQVAAAVADRRPTVAAALLRAYLATWSTDVGGWEELGALAAAAGRLDEAVWCAAEALVLAPPGGWARPARLADTYYTRGGGTGTYRRARAYYAVSLRAWRRGNVRALVGLWLSASAVEAEGGGRSGGGGGRGGEEEAEADVVKNRRLLDWAAAGLRVEFGGAAAGAVGAAVLRVLDTGVGWGSGGRGGGGEVKSGGEMVVVGGDAVEEVEGVGGEARGRHPLQTTMAGCLEVSLWSSGAGRGGGKKSRSGLLTGWRVAMDGRRVSVGGRGKRRTVAADEQSVTARAEMAAAEGVAAEGGRRPRQLPPSPAVAVACRGQIEPPW